MSKLDRFYGVNVPRTRNYHSFPNLSPISGDNSLGNGNGSGSNAGRKSSGSSDKGVWKKVFIIALIWEIFCWATNITITMIINGQIINMFTDVMYGYIVGFICAGLTIPVLIISFIKMLV